MVIVVNENDVEIAAVTEFFATQFAISQDRDAWLWGVALTQALPAPLQGDTQDAVGQCTEVVSNKLDGQASFNVARERAKHLTVMGATQQIQ